MTDKFEDLIRLIRRKYENTKIQRPGVARKPFLLRSELIGELNRSWNASAINR